MVSADPTKTIYLIIHSQKQSEEKVREKLVLHGFKSEHVQLASLDRAGAWIIRGYGLAPICLHAK